MKADKVTENGYELTYSYGADYERTKSVLKQGINTLNTRYYFAGYEKDVTGSTTRYIPYIAGPVGLLAIMESQGGSHTPHYTYTDHLGSILTVTNSSGTIEAEQSFDAWGRRRNPSTWALMSPVASTGLPVWLYRGYTGHEHLDQFGLINMNGRMYDPVLGRMLSPDNFIPDPLFSQDYNRYTYARNNPLVFVDPDGNIPILIPVVAGLIGGGLNLLSNLDKVKDPGSGIGYFINGVIGGMVSIANPAAGAMYTFQLNIGLDMALGHMPNFSSGKEVLKYTAGNLLTSVGVAGAGSLTLGAGSVGLLGSSVKQYITTVGTIGTLSSADLAELAINYNYVPSTGNLAPGIKQVTTVGTKTAAAAAKTSTQGVNRIYSARELVRRAAEPGPFHNFPESFN